jgi:hypothetical protein
MNIPQYKLVVCELYNPELHGLPEDNKENPNGHYLIFQSFSLNEQEDDEYSTDEEYEEDILCETFYRMNKIVKRLKHKYKRMVIFNSNCNFPCGCTYIKDILNHSIIKNYKNIITNPKHFQPHIAKCICLDGGQYIAILKTFWIKIIQRKWKKIFQERKNILQMRKTFKSLYHREISGKWYNEKHSLPSIKNIL